MKQGKKKEEEKKKKVHCQWLINKTRKMTQMLEQSGGFLK